MKKQIILLTILTTIIWSCNFDGSKDNSKYNQEVKEAVLVVTPIDTLTKHLKPFNPKLPTIGLLMYSGVLTTEITATADVFAKPTEGGKQLFNVVTIAETLNPIVT